MIYSIYGGNDPSHDPKIQDKEIQDLLEAIKYILDALIALAEVEENGEIKGGKVPKNRLRAHLATLLDSLILRQCGHLLGMLKQIVDFLIKKDLY